uniref:Uncharacterized protein n=1 Tax=Siphoviridae sp. ctoSr5 TaxID=2826460 RepID=A0A8S5MVE6_9CAUD|nr:MAG TPA: hypothetical protein [Siphoviridae sp. ctoSr5]
MPHLFFVFIMYFYVFVISKYVLHNQGVVNIYFYVL